MSLAITSTASSSPTSGPPVEAPTARPPVAAAPDDRPEWAGDPQAFAAIYEDHGRAVYGVAARICTPTQAEDVAQEVFLKLWSHPDRWDPTRGSLRTFLLLMARHAAVDAIRSDQSRRNREVRVGTWPTPPVEAVDLPTLLHERDARVTTALAKLAAPRRDAIVTAFFGGVSYREAAAILGVAEGTIKSRIRSGLEDLQRMLRDLRPAS